MVDEVSSDMSQGESELGCEEVVMVGDENGPGSEVPTSGPLASAKRWVTGVTESSPVAKKAVDATKLAGSKVTKTYDKGRRYVSQADAWQETEETVETLVDVVRVQHAMILDLLDRVSRLEGADDNRSGAEGAARQPSEHSK
jgi:hypothetical protein